MDNGEQLRRLAFGQTTDDRAQDVPDTWPATALDARILALVRLGALAATGDGTVRSYGSLADSALRAGASVEEIVDVLVGVLPITGPVRVATAAPKLALVLGYDVDEDRDDAGP
ncbi:hypothetical protein [Nocardioides sp. zg-1228]|uniref:hypothetical protein n=1 Tax=Nocardioides sp. zg-1228 TaxID=2763008 RepID=UPI0016432563|nr:hypothetical protein [Nocardioides sp. zg-1228]MBC2933734.1 hypothetical protein [Nocardioides sp. zg-1228]QSF58514.1 hypothetical protein JX575_04750 [Nocardioides sp. zg-1228]